MSLPGSANQAGTCEPAANGYLLLPSFRKVIPGFRRYTTDSLRHMTALGTAWTIMLFLFEQAG